MPAFKRRLLQGVGDKCLLEHGKALFGIAVPTHENVYRCVLVFGPRVDGYVRLGQKDDTGHTAVFLERMKTGSQNGRVARPGNLV